MEREVRMQPKLYFAQNFLIAAGKLTVKLLKIEITYKFYAKFTIQLFISCEFIAIFHLFYLEM